MLATSWMLLLLGFACPSQKVVTYGFSTKDYLIEMSVRPSEVYLGRGLVFHESRNPGREVCYSGDDGSTGTCPKLFVGSVTTVQYVVRRWDGEPVNSAMVRERVSVTKQSVGLPERRLFTKQQLLIDGLVSDIQAFGYDEADLARSERGRKRKWARRHLWRRYRQELFMDDDDKAFGIVEWQSTVNCTEILRAYAPPVEPPSGRGHIQPTRTIPMQYVVTEGFGAEN